MVANEMLDLIASQDISEDRGLSEIVLSQFYQTCAPFDQSLFNRFATASINLQRLEVSWMDQLPKDARSVLVDMIVQII